MKTFDSRPYAIADFLEWRDADLLTLSPDFQRRAVWSVKAKSYLIDSIIRSKPIPKIIVTQTLQGKRSVRTVVDGQQRLRAILEYFDGDFKISKAHNTEYAGATFDDLPEDVQKTFLQYELATDVLFDAPYAELLDIFARINTYTVSLKKQELLNAKYVGYFKNAAVELGIGYVHYFLDGSVLTKAQVTRMGEIEMAGDLLMALLLGVQTNKNLESAYREFEDKIGKLEIWMNRFDEVMSRIGTIYPPAELANTNWSRPVLFYTLFTTIAHLHFGLQGPDSRIRTRINRPVFGRVRVALDELSAKWEAVGTDYDNRSQPKQLRDFVRMSRRATTDTKIRIARVNYLGRQIRKALEK